MAVPDPWYEGISREHQAMAAHVVRLLDWGVRAPETVSREYCDALFDLCRRTLEADPNLLDLIGYVHGVANGETIDEFVDRGPSTRAKLWAALGDHLEALTGMEALGGP